MDAVIYGTEKASTHRNRHRRRYQHRYRYVRILSETPFGLDRCRTRFALLAALAMTGVSACRSTGSWRLAETDPPGAIFPLQQLTLDGDGRFEALSSAEGERFPSQGAYRWKAGRLQVKRYGFEPRTFRVKRHWDGRLEFVHEEHGRRVSAFFEPFDPEQESVNKTGETAEPRPPAPDESKPTTKPPGK